jgi:hypothetical protein
MKEADWQLYAREQRDRDDLYPVLFFFEQLLISFLFCVSKPMIGTIWNGVYVELLPILEKEKGVKKRERKEVFFS